MKRYCEKCRVKISAKATFCSQCGHEVSIKMRTDISVEAKSPVWRTALLQIILFFIYPVWFYRKQLREGKLKSGKFFAFTYYAQNIFLLSLLAGLLIGGLWIVQTIPKENQLIHFVSIFLWGFGYLGLVLFIPTVWVVMSFTFVRRFNGMFAHKYRLKYLKALLIGPLYIQFRINCIPSNHTAERRKVNKVNRVFRTSYKFAAVGLVLFLIFTPIIERAYAYVSLGDFTDLVDKGGMDFMGKYTLKTSNPKLTTMDDVSAVCKTKNEDNFTHGCNITNNSGNSIYISTINIPELYGIEVYATAHEMLHTVYTNMSPAERSKIDKEIDVVYASAQNSSDEIFKQAVAPYKDVGAETLHNELHSFLPIYKGELSPTLDEHYAKYFKNRQQLVVAYSNSEQFIIDFQNNLVGWDQGLDKWNSRLNEGVDIISKQGSLLDTYDARGSIAAYNNLVPTYNKNLELYKSDYAQYTTYYTDYKKNYDNYAAMMTALRRNITFEEATKLADTAPTSKR